MNTMRRTLMPLVGIVILFLSGPASSTYIIKSTLSCVTNAAGGTTLTNNIPFTGAIRKGVDIKNSGPNAIWCAFNGDAVSAGAGTNSRRIESNTSFSYDQTCNPLPPLGTDKCITIKCQAETAAQVAPLCTTLTEAF